jgi:polysaccharide biosynthesis protein PslF
MAESSRYNHRIVSTYHPRLCGIGIYAENFITGTTNFTSETSGIRVAAIDRKEGRSHHEYHFPVDVIIKQEDESSWIYGAKDIAQRAVEMSDGGCLPTVVSINHEFGLSGKIWDKDDYYSSLMETLRKTEAYQKGLLYIITTLHTILPNPNEHIKSVTRSLVENSDATIVLSALGRDILKEVYQLDPQKNLIEHIDHGVRLNNYDKNEIKDIRDSWGVKQDAFIFDLPGLIAPGKGIFKYSIPAYARAVEELNKINWKTPTRCIIVGDVHPAFRKSPHFPQFVDESTRELKQSGLLLNAKNPFTEPVTLKQIGGKNRRHGIMFSCFPSSETQYSQTFAGGDTPVFPYLNPVQISSGQISESMGHGRAPISSKFWHACEMIAPDQKQSLEDILQNKLPQRGQIIGKGDENARGLLVDCNCGEETIMQLKEAMIYCVTHPEEQRKRSQNARLKGNEMLWDKTFKRNLELIEKIKRRRRK